VSATVRYLARFLAPILYTAGFVPVMIGTISLVSYIEGLIGFDNFTTFRHNGDVAAAASVLVIGGLVFGLLGGALLRLEGLQRSTFRDHTWHCMVLCVFMATLGVWLVATYEHLAAQGVSLGRGLAVIGVSSAGYAILIDALLLLHQRRRSDLANSGEIA
jgi:hypothetical protein